MHIDNKEKDVLILSKGPTQGLNHTLTAEFQYSINFTKPVIEFFLTLHYKGSNSFLFLNPRKIFHLKVKDSEIKWIYSELNDMSTNFVLILILSTSINIWRKNII